MGGGNGQKAKMAREKNLEKSKGAKGSQLDTNKKAMSIQCIERAAGSLGVPCIAVQGVYADIHVHYYRGEVQGAC
ncbi:uncharacterized protein At2g23090-like isoform X3 [Tripterygium wilfordii]|uniref:uncharacterized protein At2g23090-like isoform X3 n=1 Tax=Tripterygium wilfordii TaxID=458696 RepID=UPI0018F7E91C|nr:uncharacterized protein At2g23090-like isoform X3 [Tripterygium wilfordii]